MIELAVADGVATATLSRPPVNAISAAWVARFNRHLDALAARSDWRVLHIRSTEKTFSAGADLAEVRERFERPDGPDQMATYVAAIQDLYERIEALPQISLAEISGAAMGGGFELALACDLRIAANEAKIGLPEARLGLIPGAGGTQRLTRLCGHAVAARVILSAEILDGAAAAGLGIVHWAVPRDRLPGEARQVAARIAELSGAALAASKECIVMARTPGVAGYAEELAATRRLFQDPDTQGRIRAFFDGAKRS